jgi:hypothetical protein
MIATKLQRLKRVVEALDNETWHVSKASANCNVCAESNGRGYCPAVAQCVNRKVAEYVAAFDPVTIEGLLAEIKALRAEVEALRAGQPLPGAA